VVWGTSQGEKLRGSRAETSILRGPSGRKETVQENLGDLKEKSSPRNKNFLELVTQGGEAWVTEQKHSGRGRGRKKKGNGNLARETNGALIHHKVAECNMQCCRPLEEKGAPRLFQGRG